MNWKRAFIAALFVLPVLGVFWLGFGTDPRSVPAPMQGQQAPDVTLPELHQGEMVSLASLRGKPVILNFWATWCEPCKKEHPILQKGHQLYGDKVHFVGIVYQDDADLAKAYLKTAGDGFLQLFDADGETGVDFGLSGVPETYFLTAEGRILRKQVGLVRPSIIEGAIDEMLGGAK